MLQLKQIHKQYKTGEFVQTALDRVSLNLRDNEFVAILGPSGSGKTTLLNIIGGLDRYDSGDLIINGVSTQKYSDRDWDSYRNHTIGFVFQSYNLIPHQTVLSNVELALTISGVSRAERKRRAKAALEQVGLGTQCHKRPGEMSGGQMQRVAIARALVNDPDILLADEPTGALDSETSIQVMELLKQVAKDRLVVMVTHNPELAERYATRIVTLKDGVIRSDSMPYEPDRETQKPPVHRNLGKASMSVFTSLALSFQNLRTKKARTLLTAFAGSIGIIGIALILSLSNGVNNYIESVEKDTLSEYPLQIQSAGIDFSSMLMANMPQGGGEGRQDGRVSVNQMITGMLSHVNANDLASLKRYLDSGDSGIENYASAVEYLYNVSPQIFRSDADGVRQVNPDQTMSVLGFGSGSASSLLSSMTNTDVFFEMPQNAGLYQDQYDVMAGRWPEDYNECVVVLSAGGSISDFALYTLGLRDSLELEEMLRQFANDETVQAPPDFQSYAYEDFLGIDFKLVNGADYYVYDSEYGLWRDKSGDGDYLRRLVERGETLSVVGVVQPKEGAAASMLRPGIGYPASLSRHVAEKARSSRIVQEQLAKPENNVFNGEAFDERTPRSGFDLASLFSVDMQALSDAFRLDGSDFSETLRFDGGSLDLSGMLDPSQISMDVPELPELNLGELFGNLDLDVSADALRTLLEELLLSYREYAAEHPEADYSRLDEYFAAYLQTPEAQERFTEGIKKILEENGTLTVSPEALKELILDVLSGFEAYVQEQGMTDPEQLAEALQAYLQMPEVQQKIREGAEKIVSYDGDITILPEQLTALAADMFAGYQEYAAANGLADPTKMGQSLLDFLQTPEIRVKLMETLSQMLDTDALERQLSAALQEYLKTALSGVSSGLQAQISSAVQQAVGQIADNLAASMAQSLSAGGMASGLQVDSEALMNAVQLNMGQEELAELLKSLFLTENTSCDGNLKKLGYADFDQPGEIRIYPLDFESKGKITAILEDYNRRMQEQGAEEKVIQYTDMVGTMMSSVTDIVNIISYVLVAFVAISLVVSSIMIGVITYISVMERRKEIGILRAIGASKRNISQVFNAETFIVGLLAGVIGIGMTLLLLLPGNAILHSLTGQQNVSASLPAFSGFVLIVLSTLLTMLGGWLPSKSAARCNPVTALRAE